MDQLTDLLTPEEQEVFTASGLGTRAGFGKRPVILVVDVNYNFCGDRPLPVLESIKTWRNSCGEIAWTAVEHTTKLLDAARRQRIPVIYTTTLDPRPDGFESGRWADKNSRRGEDAVAQHAIPGNEIVAPIAPQPQDIVIKKNKPSAFFATLLTSYMTDLGADSAIVVGTTTSGCVRATVLDGFSYNFRMSVVEECTFDRVELTHRVSMFDMHQKYADVVTLDETIEFLESLPNDLYIDTLRSLPAVPQ